MKWRWLPIFAPAAIAAALKLLTAVGWLPNPIIRILIDLGNVIFFSGVLFTLLAGLSLFLWDRMEAIRLSVLIEAAEDRRRFLSRLDHELKNPLTAILAGLANIRSIMPETNQVKTITSIETQAQRLSRLVADLRKLADLETREIERSSIDVTELLNDIYSIAQSRAVESSRTITLSIPKAPWPLPVISGDHDLLFLSVHNLLDNALKFTRPGDTIEIRAFEDSAHVVIEVADTGPGIEQDDQPHVWEELYRSDGARGIPGSGLGLALVRGIVTRHGGQVNLRSRPGQGTVFALRLPTNESARLPAKRP